MMTKITIRIPNRLSPFFPLLLIALQITLGCQSNDPGSQEGPQIARTEDSKPALVFAGLSGMPPRFIEAGPNKGTGWADYETVEIRKGLREDGFRVEQEWMSPARIEHDLQRRNPICTWPVEWKDPKKVFSRVSDRIYSIPLLLKGDETRSILILKQNRYRFAPHFDAKGDISLESLIQDKKLKTLLVRDRDYGDLSTLTTGTEPNGDQMILPSYRTHISLLVIRNNIQLLEMLNASRFDYILSDSIEENDYAQANISPARFQSLSIGTRRITDIHDPKLTRVSIACSKHPLAIQAMPYINKWISRVRSTAWVNRKAHYRSSIDLKFSPTLGYSTSIIENFRGVFESGGADQWYPLQQKQNPELLLFPPEQIAPPGPQISALGIRPTLRRWKLVSTGTNSYLLIHPGSGIIEKPFTKYHEALWSGYPLFHVLKYLSEAERAILTGLTQDFSDPKGWLPMKQIQFPPPTHPLRLTVLAQGLSTDEMELILPTLQKAEAFALIGANPTLTQLALGSLSGNIKHLNLAGSSLFQAQSSKLFSRFPKLQTLILADSQLTPTQLGPLLKALPPSLETLSLAYLRSTFTRENCAVFSTVRLPKLALLDLENSALYDEHFQPILSGFLPPSMKTLILKNNFLTPRTISKLLSKPLPALSELDLSTNSVGSQLNLLQKFPDSIKTLALSDAQISAESLMKIQFPSQLTSLDVSSNELGDLGVVQILGVLHGKLKALNLQNTGLKDRALKNLTDHSSITEIESLSLSNNLLSDANMIALTKIKGDVQELFLSGNQIHNLGAEALAKRFANGLRTLDLSNNPIGEEGIATLTHLLGASLRTLSLGSLASFDAARVQFPSGLRVLDLSNNQLTDSDMVYLAKKLPHTLLGLRLGGSLFGAPGASALANSLSEGLFELDLIDTPLSAAGLQALAPHLPATLNDLSFGGIELTEGSVTDLARNLPPSLRVLSLRRFEAPQGNLIPLLGDLPPSLSELYLRSLKISAPTILKLSAHWPGNIRRLHLSGVPLGDEQFSPIALSLPETIEELCFLSAGIGDASIAKLNQRGFENVYILQWGQNKLSSSALNAFLSRGRPIWFVVINGNSAIDDTFLRGVPAKALAHVRHLSLMNSPLGESTWLRILKQLPADMDFLGLTSAKLTPFGAEKIAPLLPRVLRAINIRGTEIGEKGRAAFRKKAEAQAIESGTSLRIDE